MRFYVVVLILALVTACSHTPQEHSYQLMSPEQTEVSRLPEQPIVYLRPIQMSSFISGRGLVYQISDIELIQAKNHVWAQEITQQIRQKMTLELRNNQRHYWVQYEQASQNAISIRLDRFQAVYTGNALLAGEWTLTEQGKVTAHQAFNIAVPLNEEGGYQAQVVALSQGVSELAQLIVDGLP